ncbi:hypothetical protein GCM10027414_10170 [Humibacter ginsengiterrae]|jgi:hypothetical protein
MTTATRRRTGRFIGMLGGIAITALLLSGCSAVNGLSRVASCSRLASAGSDLKDSLTGLSAQSDPAAALSTVTQATDAFSSAMKDVRDAQVKAKADAVTSALHALAAELKAAPGIPPAQAETKLETDKAAVLDAASAAKAVCE